MAKSIKKKINFVIQSKGGSGKSMLTYLLALKHELNKNVAFIDLDQSTRTSTKQLEFLTNENRIFAVSITDNIERIDREKLVQVIQALSEQEYNEFVIDCGAPESEQLPKLFTLDFDSTLLPEIEKEFNVEITFYVVVAGGAAYKACMNYLQSVVETIPKEKIVVYYNEQTFQNDENQNVINNFKGIIENEKLTYKPFGNFYVDRSSGKDVIHNVTNGFGIEGYKGFIAKKIIQQEIKKV